MPIYEYACKNCDHTLEALQKIADAPLVDCPACGKPALRRLLSAPRFRLKGQGWYETDFKKENQRNIAGEKEPASADKPAADKSSDKGSDKGGDKGEDKPAKKSVDAADSKPKSPTDSKTTTG
jgi:putative FmdB family regulatory protein